MAERLVGRPAPDFTMETATETERFRQVSLSDYVANGWYSSSIRWTSHFVCPTEITALPMRPMNSKV